MTTEIILQEYSEEIIYIPWHIFYFSYLTKPVVNCLSQSRARWSDLFQGCTEKCLSILSVNFRIPYFTLTAGLT